MKTGWLMMAGLIALCGMAQAGFVTIGNAGNAADTDNGGVYGDVAYTYKISQYEVTGAEFSSAVASDSRISSSTPNSGNNPAVYVTWFEAAKFCNWLTTGDAYLGAYQFNSGGALTNVMTRAQMIANSGLFYTLPTEDEWYKAAYFKGGVYSLYANGSGTAPVAGTDANYNNNAFGSQWAVGSGTMEQNGTYDMNGNVSEWNESAWDGTLDNMNEDRVIRGGSYGNGVDGLRSSYRGTAPGPANGFGNLGFRVAAIPEPASAMLVFFGAGVGVVIHRLRRSAMRR